MARGPISSNTLRMRYRQREAPDGSDKTVATTSASTQLTPGSLARGQVPCSSNVPGTTVQRPPEMGKHRRVSKVGRAMPWERRLLGRRAVLPNGTTSFSALQGHRDTPGELVYFAFGLLHLDGCRSSNARRISKPC
jgi:hypothetical protein